jgi:hypothetical protein
MMGREQAVALFKRLAAHWPSLASREAAVVDWIEWLKRGPYSIYNEAVDWVIQNWTRDRAPHIGDMQAICRDILARRLANTQSEAAEIPEVQVSGRVRDEIRSLKQQLKGD